MQPTLTEQTVDGVTFLTDAALFDEAGIRVAFTQRHGGVSESPYATLNLSTYVGDDVDHVAQNRERICRVLGLNENAIWTLNTANQIHGAHVAVAVDGAYEHPMTDALITAHTDTPLLLCFADCVPIILVDRTRDALAVVHAGWRGTLEKIAARTIIALTETYGCDPADLIAYIGPYIGLQHFTVNHEIGAQFSATFGTLIAGETYIESDDEVRLDLGVAIEETLVGAGVVACNIINPKIDTMAHAGAPTGAWFSYRAENGTTGRHGALACVCS
ncbi:MAG: polyphenol oxidase family protein [Coriobacteriia bacterium]|nr:polyphenol oxidase family protein [Coriobacteriia bacterium]